MTWILFSNFFRKTYFLSFFLFFFYYSVKTKHLWLARALFQLLFFQMATIRKVSVKKLGRVPLLNLLLELMDQANICVLRFLPTPLKKVILYLQSYITLRLLTLSFVMLTRGLEKTNLGFQFTGSLTLLLAIMTLTSCVGNFLGLHSGSRFTRKVHIQQQNLQRKEHKEHKEHKEFKLYSACKKAFRLALITAIASHSVSESFLLTIHSLLLIK